MVFLDKNRMGVNIENLYLWVIILGENLSYKRILSFQDLIDNKVIASCSDTF